MPKTPWAIGIDIGGTKIEISHVDNFGSIKEKILLDTDYKKGFQLVEEDLVKSVKQLQKNEDSPPVGIGIGMAGQIDAETGSVIFAPNLKWHNAPLKSALEASTKLPVLVTNDVRAALWGEWIHGAGKGHQNLICIFVGTGIGGGIVVGGKILNGQTNCGGEIGHMSINYNGLPCTCGNSGCFEAYAGGWGIAKRAQDTLSKLPTLQSGLRKLKEPITGKDVIEASHNGDTFAKELIEDVIKALGAGITNLVNIFNPECIILGGGVMYGLPEAISPIQAYVNQHALKSASSCLKIVEAQLKGSAGSIGAATYALHSL